MAATYTLGDVRTAIQNTVPGIDSARALEFAVRAYRMVLALLPVLRASEDASAQDRVEISLTDGTLNYALPDNLVQITKVYYVPNAGTGIKTLSPVTFKKLTDTPVNGEPWPYTAAGLAADLKHYAITGGATSEGEKTIWLDVKPETGVAGKLHIYGAIYESVPDASTPVPQMLIEPTLLEMYGVYLACVEKSPQQAGGRYSLFVNHVNVVKEMLNTIADELTEGSGQNVRMRG